jgi:hypothetical protein
MCLAGIAVIAGGGPEDQPANRPAAQTLTGTPAPATTVAPLPATSAPEPTTQAPTLAPTTSAPKPVHYANCTAVRGAGKAPLRKGRPGYRAGLDRDGDGVACEASEGSSGGSSSGDSSTGGNSGSVYYANCAAVRAAGKAPLHRGEPGYSRKLDRDGDGVACE